MGALNRNYLEAVWPTKPNKFIGVPGSQPDSQVISNSQVSVEMQMYPEPGVSENLSASETCSLDLKDNLQTLNKMSNDYGPIYYYLQGILNPSVKFFFFS